MHNTHLISIIIPTYNRAHILSETLNSILAQTYGNWECIIVDDGSTDNTFEALKKLLENDSRFRYFKRPNTVKNGPSACRNFGYEQCIGEYVQWFDSDDVMHPEKLKLKLESALQHRAEVIIDNHSESDNFTQVVNIQAKCFTANNFYIDFLLGKKPIITNDVMIKSSILSSIRFDENLWKGEEYEFYARVFQQNLTYCFLDVALTRYRISEDSISISPKQTESLIYLSKKLQAVHYTNPLIVAKAERQGQKTYKSLVKKKKIGLILKHFKFFSKCHKKNSFSFSFFLMYNVITGKGFDRIKPKQL